MSKAFDLVDHILLGKKLVEANVPPDLVYILMHYLRNQSGRVCWGISSGEYSVIDKGVRQGGLISPLLFKFYINSLVNTITEKGPGCSLGLSKLNIIAYADDLVLLAKSEQSLGLLYKLLKSQISQLKLKINISKTKGILFSKKVLSDTNYHVNFTLDNDIIVVERHFKYLGHYVECGLKDTTNIKNRLNEFYSKFNSFYRSFDKINIDTLLFLFNSYCSPNFGIELWNSDEIFKNQFFKVFETAFSNALKRMTSVPRYASSHIVAEMCNQLLLKHLVARIQLGYYRRLLSSQNKLIRLNLPILRNGLSMPFIFNNFKLNYGVNIENNDWDALRSRLFFYA